MLNIDLRNKRAFIAGVADDGGFGFAIAKALAEAGASVSVGTWPPALGIFQKLLERGKMDESMTLSDGRKMAFEKIYPLDAAYDAMADVPPEILENKRYKEQGDFTMMAQMSLFMRRFLAPLPAMALATDAASPVSPGRQRRVGRLARRSLFENAVNAPSADFATALGVAQMPARMHQRLRTSVPGYFISGDLDSRTPPENAEEVRRGFRTSAHLVLEGAGHDNDLFLSSPIILERIGAFLRGEPVRDERVQVDILRFE